uniref:Uncharacterized protein n=1 Tax=viral metagenome TaxID=1070528 RepID=A0A6C0DTM2_9ZZZZ
MSWVQSPPGLFQPLRKVEPNYKNKFRTANKRKL